MTCYDLRFPELARSLVDAGKEVLLVGSSWVPGEHKTEQWLVLNAAGAIENSVYVAGVCQTPPVSVGRSVLVDPMGVGEADAGLEAVCQRGFGGAGPSRGKLRRVLALRQLLTWLRGSRWLSMRIPKQSESGRGLHFG